MILLNKFVFSKKCIYIDNLNCPRYVYLNMIRIALYDDADKIAYIEQYMPKMYKLLYQAKGAGVFLPETRQATIQYDQLSCIYSYAKDMIFEVKLTLKSTHGSYINFGINGGGSMRFHLSKKHIARDIKTVFTIINELSEDIKKYIMPKS